MARRQQSFFDQPVKKFVSWAKPRRPNALYDASYHTVQNIARPPIAASLQVRSKLMAFRFHEDSPENMTTMIPDESLNHDKENRPVISDAHKTPIPSKTKNALPMSQRSTGRDARDCPQTPAGRLPLTELLANNEENRQQPSGTPVERVMWESASINSSLTSTKPSQKRKRATSHSPPSSSEKRQNAILDLKTPRMEPADDLWNRLTLHTTERRSPSAPNGPLFASFLQSSSPQTPATTTSRDAKLRRTLSCIDWPTSAAKRRKIYQDDDAKESVPRFADSAERSKMTRVSALVDKMHSGLSRSRRSPAAYSSSEPAKSSPTRVRNDSPEHRRPATVPEQDHNLEFVVTSMSQTAVKEQLARTAEGPPQVQQRKDAQSFDFDDDMHEGFLEAAHAEEQIGVEDLAGMSDDVELSTQSDRAITHHQAEVAGTDQCLETILTNGAAQSTVDDDDDEFGEDVGDEFAADLEEVFELYESQQPVAFTTRANQPVNMTHEDRSPSRVIPAGKPAVDLVSDDEDFGDDSDFEQLAAECAEATQSVPNGADTQLHRGRDTAILQRYVIKTIFNSQYGDGEQFDQKLLSVECERTRIRRAILLRQLWLDTPCKTGAYVHVIGRFDRYGQCIIDNAHNLLIIHPDHLISSTVVGDSFTCIRKSVLQDRVKATSDTNQSLVYGQILHEIFQEALRCNQWDDDFMYKTITNIVTKHLEAIYEINIDLATAVDQLKERINDLQAWAQIFVSAKPKPNAVVKDRNGARALMSINKLLEVEEHIWSPAFGLKGNIDATVQVCLDEGDGQKILTVPFELKTGKHTSAAHKAQTSLYSLLLSDRYDVDIACGILYYMQTSEISSIRTLRHELVPMIIQRNQIADHVRNRAELPPMLAKAYTCNKCYAKTPCFIYHRMIDDGNGETSGMGDKFDEVVKHLHPAHQEFFRKWDSLLTKEEADVVKIRKELWTMQSSEREKVGRCFGGLIVEHGSFHSDEDASKINRYEYTLMRKAPSPTFSFTESQLTVGEPIVISDEKGHFALANGYVISVRKHKIQVVVDRRLHNARTKSKNFDAKTNQAFAGIMEVREEGGESMTSTPVMPEEPAVYRLDKDEFSNGMAMVRNNLIRLMEKDVFGVQALRRLIVEGVAPTFRPMSSGFTLGDTASQASLNIDQRAAIEKVMSAKDYALVLGMPGTGKTTTIAHIIQALVAQGKTVLLTSYTHTAVDNILLKLRKDNIGIFRLGAVAKVHPEVQEFADLGGRPIKTTEELKRCYTQKVVATTCLGINHPIFNQRIFDYCIVDEASQITLPVCLGPIRMARTFILVGDHYQLPPLVQNKQAIEGGLDVSLFKMLSEKHPSSVVNLEHQYRMSEDIMALSNTLIYNGRLKCGTYGVATRTCRIPNMPALERHHHTTTSSCSARTSNTCRGSDQGACWIRDLLDPSVKACFVNTDALGSVARETLEAGSRTTNPCEVALTIQLVESLVTTGIQTRDVGLITLYRSQLALMKQALRHHSGLEMHTADKFQGRDKEIVILSLVRSNEQQIVGDLLKDWRRVNVAFTRARTKLLILGSRSTLIGNELLNDFVKLMESKDWIYNLPADATKQHLFEEVGTQISEMVGLSAGSPVKGMKVLKEIVSPSKKSQVKRKVPLKQGRFDVDVVMKKRQVLRDIINDAA